MFTLNCKGRLLVIDEPLIMGIINVTPDSFYSGSRKTIIDEVLRTAEQMLIDGAAILDVGGQSTRPGSEEVGQEAEMERVLPVIEAINQRFPQSFISVDTYYATVATEAVAAGASIVNDISSGTLDDKMVPAVGRLHVPYIAMHMKGTPQTMQKLAVYEDVTLEVLDFFIKKIEECKIAGINDVIVDAGFGFAKTIDHNFTLLKNQSVLKILGKPLLTGLSRKATVYKTLGVTAENALNGTTVLNTIALLNGANILRVHDVREAVEAVKLVGKLK